jgi:hypothetical protein
VSQRFRQDWWVVTYKLAVDPTDGLLFGNDQSGEVFGEVASFRFVGKQITKDV